MIEQYLSIFIIRNLGCNSFKISYLNDQVEVLRQFDCNLVAFYSVLQTIWSVALDFVES